jgi:putative spermidine/putrescine transport system ATP-binding protein
MPHLQVSAVVKHFGAHTVVDGLDFAVERGELVSLLGPSGCGKTTLLRLIAGLVKADAGRITLAGRELAAVPAHRRNVSSIIIRRFIPPKPMIRQNLVRQPDCRRL